MADYASTVTLDFPWAKKIGSALYILSGKVNVTNYNQVLAEITGITRKLRRVYNVICDGISANGFVPRWDRTAKSIKCFYPTKAITPAGSVAAPVFTGSALAAHDHDVLITGGQAAGEALQQLASVIGKTAAGNVTDTTAVQGISAGTPAGTNSAPTFTGTAVAAQAGTEVVNVVAVGEINFVAYGYR